MPRLFTATGRRPELMRAAADLGLRCEPEHGCITCGDEAAAMRVVRVDAARELALCESPTGERQTVEVAFVGEVAEGDGVLVHAGVALARDPA